MTHSTAPATSVQTFPQRMTMRIVRLSRLARIGLVALFALAVTLLLVPQVDAFYLTNMFDWNTRLLPALVSCAFGLLMYAVGWWLIIGVAGTTPPVRRAAFWYCVVGIAAVALAGVLLVYGAISTTV